MKKHTPIYMEINSGQKEYDELPDVFFHSGGKLVEPKKALAQGFILDEKYYKLLTNKLEQLQKAEQEVYTLQGQLNSASEVFDKILKEADTHGEFTLRADSLAYERIKQEQRAAAPQVKQDFLNFF
jgi:hypothetical protein